MNTRSTNLSPLTVEDIFDKTPTHAVVEFSEDIDYAIQKQAANGMTANVMFTILHFYAARMMSDITAHAADRVGKGLEQSLAEMKEA
jgi:hypothetical protein